ncbi:MAG: VWA domain-containing protein [Terriglobales bacterium]
MKSRTAILVLGILLMGGFVVLLGARAQDAGQAELPSAPSPSSHESQSQAPAAPAQTAPSQPPTQETPVPSDSVKRAAATPAAQPANDAGKKVGTASTSTSPAGTILSDDESLTTIRHTVNEVNVLFTVTDKHGRYVKDLKKEDFKVVDDNKPAAEIRSFHAETNLPLEVGLLIDASNSVRDRFKFEQQAAVEFLNQTIRPRYDEAFVLGFDVTPEVTQDFTDNTELLSVGVRALRPGGGTAMYDALYFACRDKLMKAQHSGPVRRAIILLSDGDDNQSHVTREEAIDMAQRADVIVYTISTNLSGAGHHGDKVLERIADATGGRSYVPFQITEVANAFAAIQEELRSQYAISYKPADFVSDGRYRSVEILALGQKGLRVRSRRGYYAPTQ